MDTTLLHPKLVHLPLALAVLMPLLAGGVLLAWWRGWLPKRTWTLVVAGQALLVLSGFLSMRTGEADEERVERVVPEGAIESHEEAAELFVQAGGVTLLLLLAPWLLRNRKAALVAASGAAVATVVVLALGYRTGAAGGDLVYRHGAAQAFADGAGAGSTAPAHRDGDGDDR